MNEQNEGPILQMRTRSSPQKTTKGRFHCTETMPSDLKSVDAARTSETKDDVLLVSKRSIFQTTETSVVISNEPTLSELYVAEMTPPPLVCRGRGDLLRGYFDSNEFAKVMNDWKRSASKAFSEGKCGVATFALNVHKDIKNDTAAHKENMQREKYDFRIRMNPGIALDVLPSDNLAIRTEFNLEPFSRLVDDWKAGLIAAFDEDDAAESTIYIWKM
jgi:hypothetical protein